MNKYHNWPDTRVKFYLKNSILLFQTNIFLSILNRKSTWIHHWKACDLSYTETCVTQNFPNHKCLAFCFTRSYMSLILIYSLLQRLYFVESLQKTLVDKNTYTKNKFSMEVYYIHTTKIPKKKNNYRYKQT